MLRGDPLDDRQPQPGALSATGLVAANERIEDLAQLLRINTRPPVEHAQHNIGRIAVARDMGRNLDPMEVKNVYRSAAQIQRAVKNGNFEIAKTGT